MKKRLAYGFLFFLLMTAARAEIYLSEPKDKLQTFEEVVMLKGRGERLENLRINRQKVKINSEGTFSCGLVLRPGKNFVEVLARDRRGKVFTRKLHLLRLITFPDIETLYEGQKHWARNQIIWLATPRFIEGYPDGNYYPGNPITRGELATWIARVKKLKLPRLTQDVYLDVPKEHWRAPFIKAAAEAGYMQSYDRQTFGIDDPVSRREAAEIAVLSEGKGVIEKIRPLFVDVPKEERGAIPIYTARERGLVIGVSKAISVFDPNRALTRAEAAVLLSRFYNSYLTSQWLLNFGEGFSENNFCALNNPPEIVSFKVQPATVKLGTQTNLILQAKIAPRQGLYPISKVKVDLSSVGGVPDAEMYDDGTHGDKSKGDLIYSLSLSLMPDTTGEKKLTVTVVDRLSWEAKRDAALLILK